MELVSTARSADAALVPPGPKAARLRFFVSGWGVITCLAVPWAIVTLPVVLLCLAAPFVNLLIGTALAAVTFAFWLGLSLVLWRVGRAHLRRVSRSLGRVQWPEHGLPSLPGLEHLSPALRRLAAETRAIRHALDAAEDDLSNVLRHFHEWVIEVDRLPERDRAHVDRLDPSLEMVRELIAEAPTVDLLTVEAWEQRNRWLARARAAMHAFEHSLIRFSDRPYR